MAARNQTLRQAISSKSQTLLRLESEAITMADWFKRIKATLVVGKLESAATRIHEAAVLAGRFSRTDEDAQPGKYTGPKGTKRVAQDLEGDAQGRLPLLQPRNKR